MASSSSANSDHFDLALGLKLSYEHKSIPNLIKDLSRDEKSDELKLLILNGYLLKYKEELIFADVFNQELPQCRLLLLDAIELLKEEINKIKRSMGLQVVEKLFPRDQVLSTKMIVNIEDQQHKIDLNNPTPNYDDKMQDDATLITTQAANLSLYPKEKQAVGIDMRLKVNDRGLMKCKLKPLTQPTWRNNRRSWTPELHSRFVVVLHLLGGPEVATPKQIKEQMKVEGLTTNQVKSHLQKYRLNWRRTPDTGDERKAKLYCSDLPMSSTGEAAAMNDID